MTDSDWVESNGLDKAINTVQDWIRTVEANVTYHQETDELLLDLEARDLDKNEQKLVAHWRKEWEELGVPVADDPRIMFMRHVERPLLDAHPVVIDAVQANALPDMPFEKVGELMEWWRNLHLPFNPLWIGIDYCGYPLADLQPNLKKTDDGKLQRSFPVLGFLIGDGVLPGSGEKTLVPFWPPTTDDEYKTHPMNIKSLYYYGGAFPADESTLEEGRDAIDTVYIPMYQEKEGVPAEERQKLYDGLENGIVGACMEAMKILYFLESANVELIERPVTRQIRRNAARKGKKIADVVHVRQGPRSKPVPRENGEKRDFSHRFEVRGHYKHHPAGTKMTHCDPDKLVNVPGRGLVRRIWCPPFVKGPQDLPLIPKIRIVDHEDEGPKQEAA